MYTRGSSWGGGMTIGHPEQMTPTSGKKKMNNSPLIFSDSLWPSAPLHEIIFFLFENHWIQRLRACTPQKSVVICDTMIWRGIYFRKEMKSLKSYVIFFLFENHWIQRLRAFTPQKSVVICDTMIWRGIYFRKEMKSLKSYVITWTESHTEFGDH